MSDQELVTAEVVQEDPELAELTWGEVIKEFFVHLETSGKGSQVRNFKTAIKLFLESIGSTEQSVVGTELTEEFTAKIKIYIDFQIDRGRKDSTYKPRVSKIRKLKIFVEGNFKKRLQLQTIPKTFGKKLHALIIALGLTIKAFWQTLPQGLLSYNALHDWCKEKRIPSKSFWKVIGTIEKYLKVPAGTLKLPKYLQKGLGLSVGESNYSNKMRAALSKPYYIWTESLEQEYQGLFQNKTRPILPEGEERSEEGYWTKNEGGDFPTAEAAQGMLKSFMGFCALAEDCPDPYLRGAGIKPEDLSMALLADKQLVESYLEFVKLRSGLRVRPVNESTTANLPAHMISPNGRWEYYDKGGKYNNGSIRFLTFVSSLLRPRFGYLNRHPEYYEKLGARKSAATWQKQCKLTRNRVNIVCKDLSRMKKGKDTQNFDFGRDPKEKIQWILDLDRPLFILQEMVKEMFEDLLPESAPKLERAIQYRNFLLAALLCANPLRIIMFTYMEFDKHLIRRSDGSWWLKFGKQYFKNRRSLNSDYHVRVAKELWPLLDRYKREFHPILVGSTDSKYVFVRSKRGSGPSCEGGRMSQDSLSQIIHSLTELYLPGLFGFGPHAFRHIIATDIIKKDPRLGFFIASKALNDKLETVEKAYIHLKSSEFFEPVNAHFSEAWRYVFSLEQGNLINNIGQIAAA
jgi:integrase